ncbi:acetylxylan esterase [Bacteroides salyersiae]|nr:acetylxylan esterase [Bacteroides salyersiae]
MVARGGALAIVTAGLDTRVKALVAFYPALCDLTGYLHGRAGGWPAMFAPQNQNLNNKPEKVATSRYYDVVNFARFIKSSPVITHGGIMTLLALPRQPIRPTMSSLLPNSYS